MVPWNIPWNGSANSIRFGKLAFPSRNVLYCTVRSTKYGVMEYGKSTVHSTVLSTSEVLKEYDYAFVELFYN